jgi:hypothetical protein
MILKTQFMAFLEEGERILSCMERIRVVAISIAFNSIGSVFESTNRAGVDTDLKERTIDFDISRWTALNIL